MGMGWMAVEGKIGKGPRSSVLGRSEIMYCGGVVYYPTYHTGAGDNVLGYG